MLINPQLQSSLVNFGKVNSFNTQTFVDDAIQTYNMRRNSCSATFNRQTINKSVDSATTMGFANNVPYKKNLNACSAIKNSLNLLQNIPSNTVVSDSQFSLVNNSNTSPLITTSISTSNNELNAVDTMRKRELEIAEFLAQCRNQQQREQKQPNFNSSLNNFSEMRTRAFTISNCSLSLNSNITNVQKQQQQQEIIQQKHSTNTLAEQLKVIFLTFKFKILLIFLDIAAITISYRAN